MPDSQFSEYSFLSHIFVDFYCFVCIASCFYSNKAFRQYYRQFFYPEGVRSYGSSELLLLAFCTFYKRLFRQCRLPYPGRLAHEFHSFFALLTPNVNAKYFLVEENYSIVFFCANSVIYMFHNFIYTSTIVIVSSFWSSIGVFSHLKYFQTSPNFSYCLLLNFDSLCDTSCDIFFASSVFAIPTNFCPIVFV